MFDEPLKIDSDIREVLQMHGRLKHSNGELSNPLLLRLEHPRYDYTAMQCHLTAPGGLTAHHELSAAISQGPANGVIIRSLDYSGFECRLWAIHGHSGNAQSVRVYTHWYEMANSSWEHYELPQKEKLLATVELSTPGILSDWTITEHSFTGTIKKTGGEKGKLNWKFSTGSGEALDRYVYEEASIFNSKSTLQIKRPALFFKLDPKCFESPWDAIKTIKEETKDICHVLSFCYRRKVDWYDIQFMLTHKDIKHSGLPLPRCRRVLYKPPDVDRIEPLIDRRHLIKRGLEKLLKTYKTKKNDIRIESIIPLLASAHSYDSVETRFFLCQAALENITNSLVNLSGVSTKNNIFEKIVFCVQHYHVNTEDIWRKSNFETGLKFALSRRNRLFHGATVEPNELYSCLVRLRTLSERFLIAFLAWPEEKLWPHRDEDLRRLLD